MQGLPTPTGSAIRRDTMVKIAWAMATDPANAPNPYGDLHIALGPVEDGRHHALLNFVTGTPDLAYAVACGEIDLATLNPSGFLNLAYRGTGPFTEPLSLRAIAVLPTWDRMGFAFSERLGCASFEELRERRPAMRISIRRNPAHASRLVIDEVLGAYGLSLQDIESWGGSLQGQNAPGERARMDGIADGSVDAVFDEAVPHWGEFALSHGMRLWTLGQPAISRLEALGWPVGSLTGANVPGLTREIQAASFSGWPFYTHADLPDDVAYAMARALHRVCPALTWDLPEPGTLADLCNDTDAAPLGIPLHPGAERYYREQGALR